MVRILSLCILVAVSSVSDIDFGSESRHSAWVKFLLITSMKNIEEYLNFFKSAFQHELQTLKNTELRNLNNSIWKSHEYIQKNITALKNKIKSVETCLQSPQLQINVINHTSHRQIAKCLDRPYDLSEKYWNDHIKETKKKALAELKLQLSKVYSDCTEEETNPMDFSLCLDMKLMDAQDKVDDDHEKNQQKEFKSLSMSILLKIMTHNCIAKVNNHLNLILDAVRILADICFL